MAQDRSQRGFNLVYPSIAIAVGILMFAAMFAFQFFSVYMTAVLAHWVALMSGGVSVLIAFYQQIRKKAGPYVLYVVAAMCIFFAGFQAWQDEYRMYAAEQIQAGAPQLSAEIVQYGFAPGRTPDESIVTVFPTIYNTGADSIIKHLALQVRTSNGKLFGTQFIPAPSREGDLRMSIPRDTGRGLQLTRDDSLVKYMTQPIPHNGAGSGFAMYYVEVPMEELKSPGWDLMLSFADIKDKSYLVTYRVNGQEHATPDLSNLQGASKS